MKVLSQYLPVLWENKTIVNRKFLNLHPLQFSYSYFLVLRAQPPVPGRTNGGGERENLQYFSESSDKENEIRIHVREKRIRETGLFSIFKASKLRESQCNMKSQAARILLTQFLALFFFYTQLQTFRNEPHQISFWFLFQNHAPVSLIPIWKNGDYHNWTPIHSHHIRG